MAWVDRSLAERPRKLKSIKYSSGGSSHHEHLSAHDDQGTTLPCLSLEAVRLQTLQRDWTKSPKPPKYTHIQSLQIVTGKHTNRFDEYDACV